MPSRSKAPWGLSVLVRVNGIFTAIAISPSPSLRQCPYHYAIRAGRNFISVTYSYPYDQAISSQTDIDANHYLSESLSATCLVNVKEPNDSLVSSPRQSGETARRLIASPITMGIPR